MEKIPTDGLKWIKSQRIEIKTCCFCILFFSHSIRQAESLHENLLIVQCTAHSIIFRKIYASDLFLHHLSCFHFPSYGMKRR